MRSARAPRYGVALLTALLILALAGLLALSFITATRAVLESKDSELRAAQALELAKGLNDFAVVGLLQDGDKTTLDSRAEQWAQALPPLPIPNGNLTGFVEDLDGKINVNGFASTDGNTRSVTRVLLNQLLINLRLDPRLALNIEDAIDVDEQSNGGSEDNDYLAMRPPRRAANRALSSIEELRHVAGITPDVFALLRGHLCAIAPNAKLNINTATIPVLMSLSPAISEPIATKLYQGGSAQNADLGKWMLDLLAQDNVRLETNISQHLSLESRHFVVHSRVTLDGVQFQYHALLDRRNYQFVWFRVGDF